MNWSFRNLSLGIGLFLLLPVLLVMGNVYLSPGSGAEGHQYRGMSTLNSGRLDANYCSWACHQRTAYCKRQHVKHLGAYFEYTDPLYFGVINALHTTGAYQLANLLLFVVAGPAIMLWLFVRIIQLEQKIRQHKRREP